MEVFSVFGLSSMLNCVWSYAWVLRNLCEGRILHVLGPCVTLWVFNIEFLASSSNTPFHSKTFCWVYVVKANPLVGREAGGEETTVLSTE